LLACHASLYRYARALSRDPVMAEELVQETFIRALSAKKHPFPTTEENVRPWLFTILRNHWLNELRQRKQAGSAGELRESEVAYGDTPETAVSRRFLQSEVRDAVDALPEVYREVIVLREMENLSYAEIAQLLGCPAGTVMSRLARARTQLRSLLMRIAPVSKGAAAKGVAPR
jgi:RNA polymerase sigma-70 factor, ECF subfamily